MVLHNLNFEKVIKKFTHIGAFLEITEENLYEELTSDFTLEFYPYAEEIVNLMRKIYFNIINIPILNNNKSFSKFLLEITKSF